MTQQLLFARKMSVSTKVYTQTKILKVQKNDSINDSTMKKSSMNDATTITCNKK
ncbi:1664_t:CDS:1, partial [Gigaspora rosea]